MAKYSYRFNDHIILTLEDEYKLFEEYHDTNSTEIKHKISNTIVTHNMKFAARCARTYISKYPHVDPDDIKGYAMMGLLDAVDKFDYTLGNKFTTYAVWWVKNSINRNIEKHESLVRYPANIHQQLQQEVNRNDISNEMLSMVHSVRGGQSFDKPLNESDSSNTLGDVFHDDRVDPMDVVLASKQLSERIECALGSLNQNEQFIMKELYGFNSGEKRALREVADDMNVTHDRIRYIRTKCLEKLKKNLKVYVKAELNY